MEFLPPACFTGILLTWTITSSYSQSQVSTAKPGSLQDEYISSSEEINAPKHSASAFLNEISTKAVRDFTRDYKNVSDAKWVKMDKGFFVIFSSDGVQTRIYYNKKGDRECLIRDYREDKLSPQIRHLVKSTYYDFSIYLVNEVTIDGLTAYIVKIQDKTSLKTIKIVDGEMEVTAEYIKSE